jgi:hypothetical protein
MVLSYQKMKNKSNIETYNNDPEENKVRKTTDIKT